LNYTRKLKKDSMKLRNCQGFFAIFMRV